MTGVPYLSLNVTGTPVNSLTDEELLVKLNNEMRAAVLWVTVYVGLEAIVGFFGNLLVLYVFTFRYRECNFRYFVLCLACTDFVSCLTTVPGEIVTQQYWYMYPYPTICKIKSFFNVFTISAEAFCLFVIAVDRYRKVCRPLQCQISPSVAKVLCVVIYVCAFSLGLPTAIFWGTHSIQKHYMNRTITATVCEKDQEFVRSSAPLKLVTSIEAIVAIFLTAMFVLYALVARKLVLRWHKPQPHCSTVTDESKAAVAGSKADMSSTECVSSSEYQSKTHETSNTQSKSSNCLGEDATEANTNTGGADDSLEQNHRRVGATGKSRRMRHRIAIGRNSVSLRIRRKTKIMLALTACFFVTAILYLTLLDIIARSGEQLEPLSNNRKAVYFFFFRFVFINHVINPLVYGFWDATFRRFLREMKQGILQACCRRPQHNS